MSTSGRFLLLFLLLWAASRDAPCLAEQEGPPVQLVAPRQVGRTPATPVGFGTLGLRAEARLRF